MWAAIIIVLVIAMVIGPVMLMRPSKRDQYLARLRAKAREYGMQVSASRVKDDSGAPCWFYWCALGSEDESQKVRHEPFLLERKGYSHDLHIAEYYEMTKGHSVPEGGAVLIASFPESVQGIELNRHALGVHWSERGGEEALASIADTLTQLLRLLHR